MQKAKIKLFLGNGNWMNLHPICVNEEQEFKINNLLNKLSVISTDSKHNIYRVSLYHYEEIIDICERKNILVMVHKDVIKRYKLLNKKINKKKFSEPITPPELWTEDKSKKIFKYQYAGIRAVLNRQKFILADDMGLGKTIQAIAVMLYAFEEGYNRALIVCNSPLKYQWKNELSSFTKLKEEDITIFGEIDRTCPKTKPVDGACRKFNKARIVCKSCELYKSCSSKHSVSLDKFRRNQLLKENSKIIIINYAMISKYVEQIKRAGFDIYIVDEVSKLKNRDSNVTRAFLKISRTFKYDDIFMPMSGTLIENRITEFYPVFRMIDDAIFGTWTNFKNAYMFCDFFGVPVGIKNEEKLKNITSKFFIRRTIEEVWQDRPELFESYRFCEMLDVQRRIYLDIANGKVSDLKEDYEDKINSAQVAVLINYLIMASDTLESVKELGGNSPEDYSCKIAMLKEIMTEEIPQHKVVLFSKFANKVIPVIEREMTAIGVKSLVITGGTSNKDREKKKALFSKKDKHRLLICSDAMSYGSNLQCARYIINFDLPWNPAILDQRIRRVYRTKQKNDVVVINMITKDSIEDFVLDKIYSKREMFDKFMGASVKAKSLTDNINIDSIQKFFDNV